MLFDQIRLVLLLLVALTALNNRGVQSRRTHGWVKMNYRQVCFGARDNKYGSFHYSREGIIAAIRLVYRHGYVRCIHGSNGNSRWGCADRGLSVIGTDQHNQVLFPSSDRLKHHSHKAWYILPFAHSSTSAELVFTDFAHPFFYPRRSEIRIWYGEDLRGYTESDNYGRVCVDVYAKFIK